MHLQNTQNNFPSVSVILPNYNYEQYLPERIESILNQSFINFELIILDDASKDKSLEIIQSYKDERIRYIFNKNNKGNTFKQWEKGIKESKGDYIWIAEADDYCKLDFLEKLYNKIIQSGSDIVFSESIIVDEKGISSGKWSEQRINNNAIFQSDFDYEGHSFIGKYLIYENVIPNASAVLFSKKSYIKTGGINTNITNCADWLLWLKMLHTGKISFLTEPLNFFRRHPDSVINKSKIKVENQAKFHEYYSLSMRQNYYKYLPKTTKYKQIRIINNSYIKKDLKRKILFFYKKKNLSFIKYIYQYFQLNLYF